MTPKCPNHVVPMQKSDQPRIYICPISGYRFQCDVEEQASEEKKDKFGNTLKEFKIKPLDGQDG
jgi:hypothetical protein